MVDAIVEVVSENPWYAVVAVGGSLVVLVLLVYCCCRSPATDVDAHYKKTDEPVPDVQPEELDGLAGSGTDAEGSGSDADKQNDENMEGEDADEEIEDEEKEGVKLYTSL